MAIAVGLVAAGGVAYTFSQIGTEAEKAADGVEKLSDEVKRLNEIARESGRSRWNMQDIATFTEEKTIGDLEKANKKITEQEKLLQKRNELMKKWKLFQGDEYHTGGIEYYRKKILEINKELENSLKLRTELATNIMVQKENSMTPGVERDRKEIEQKIAVLQDALKIQPQNRERLEKVIEAFREDLRALNISEYESSDKYKEIQEEINKYKKIIADATKSAADFEFRNLSESQKRQQQINDELELYRTALGERSQLQNEEAALLERVIAEREKELANAGLFDIRKEIEATKQKEQEYRDKVDNLRTLISEGGKDTALFAQKLKDLQNQKLGKWGKYIDDASDGTKDFAQKMKEAREEFLKAAEGANLTVAQMQVGLKNIQEEMRKEAIADIRSKTSGIGMPSAATFQSVDAYCVIAQAKDPSVQAIKDFQQSVLAKLDLVSANFDQSIQRNSTGSTR